MFGKKKDEVKMEARAARVEAPGAPGNEAPGGGGDGSAKPRLTPMDQRKKLSILTGACVAVAIGSVGFSAIQFSQASELMGQIEGTTSKVLVATEDLPAGSELTAANTEIALVPTRYVPRDAAKSEGDALGLRTLTHVSAGLPIDLAALSGSEAPSNVASALRDGHVAKMVSLDTASGLSPLLAPGDYVTVSGLKDDTGEVITYSGVRVIAIDGAFTGPAGTEYSTVTLELTQEQAESLIGLTIGLTAEPAAAHLEDRETAAEGADNDVEAPAGNEGGAEEDA